MSMVNELLQNIRFLKFYGWGMSHSPPSNPLRIGLFVENRWAQKATNSRETELKWRVKQNVLMTLFSFIWYAS